MPSAAVPSCFHRVLPGPGCPVAPVPIAARSRCRLLRDRGSTVRRWLPPAGGSPERPRRPLRRHRGPAEAAAAQRLSAEPPLIPPPPPPPPPGPGRWSRSPGGGGRKCCTSGSPSPITTWTSGSWRSCGRTCTPGGTGTGPSSSSRERWCSSSAASASSSSPGGTWTPGCSAPRGFSGQPWSPPYSAMSSSMPWMAGPGGGRVGGHGGPT